jgi:hypothetical protein
MVEFYMSLRAKGGAEQVMLCTADALAPTAISPALDDQIDDMRICKTPASGKSRSDRFASSPTPRVRHRD